MTVTPVALHISTHLQKEYRVKSYQKCNFIKCDLPKQRSENKTNVRNLDPTH